MHRFPISPLFAAALLSLGVAVGLALLGAHLGNEVLLMAAGAAFYFFGLLSVAGFFERQDQRRHERLMQQVER